MLDTSLKQICLVCQRWWENTLSTLSESPLSPSWTQECKKILTFPHINKRRKFSFNQGNYTECTKELKMAVVPPQTTAEGEKWALSKCTKTIMEIFMCRNTWAVSGATYLLNRLGTQDSSTKLFIDYCHTLNTLSYHNCYYNGWLV